uniref:AMP-dependent synthetase/ligase domain-containing protein n=1 Tax=Bionectria ochroleuca TaxID=29856 RepID=A0A8H7KDJ0_BIOOC
MVFKSKYPDIAYPTDLTVWEWAFEDKRYSPIFRNPPSKLAGFSNAVTGERLDFLQVKEHATYLCTALASQYGLGRDDTVSLFSQNSIWYPVAMFAVLRAGGRVNGASPSHTVDEMANALKTADTKFIITVPQSIDTALAAARKVGIPAEPIEQFKITDLALVPSIVNRLVNDPLVAKYDLTSVKLIACGAAPLGEEVIKLLEKKLPWTGFRQSYGMTESCCCLTTHPPEFYSYKYADSGGVLLASTVIKIVDLDSGNELGPNETGEILAKGPQIAMGYLANQKETAETFGADGFLHTGDIGCVDHKGFIHIVDRIKEMIKVKGQQVAPADLEQLLLGHPAVEDCAVLGIPDDRSTERPKAFVVLKQTVSPNPKIAKELLQYVKDRKIRYKWLKEIEFISEVPKSPSGKILRRVLRGKRAKEDTLFVFKDIAETSRL